MPVAYRKDATAKFCLKADEARPEGERVYFLCRFMTCQQIEEWREKITKANDRNTSDADTGRLLNEALAIGVIGPVDAKTPDGQDVPCTLAGIDMVLTQIEKFDLAVQYPRAIQLGEIDLKKSESPPPASTAESVPVAA